MFTGAHGFDARLHLVVVASPRRSVPRRPAAPAPAPHQFFRLRVQFGRRRSGADDRGRHRCAPFDLVLAAFGAQFVERLPRPAHGFVQLPPCARAPAPIPVRAPACCASSRVFSLRSDSDLPRQLFVRRHAIRCFLAVRAPHAARCKRLHALAAPARISSDIRCSIASALASRSAIVASSSRLARKLFLVRLKILAHRRQAVPIVCGASASAAARDSRSAARILLRACSARCLLLAASVREAVRFPACLRASCCSSRASSLRA